MSHLLSSETEMPVSRLFNSFEKDDIIYVTVRWKGLSRKENTSEALFEVYKNGTDLLLMILCRKNTPASLANLACDELSL